MFHNQYILEVEELSKYEHVKWKEIKNLWFRRFNNIPKISISTN